MGHMSSFVPQDDMLTPIWTAEEAMLEACALKTVGVAVLVVAKF
jgi:hypothetical protein